MAIVTCAWCGSALSAASSDLDLSATDRDGPVSSATPGPATAGASAPESERSDSHGICESCLAVLVAESEGNVDDVLNEFDVPVVLVDSTGHLLGANVVAEERLERVRERDRHPLKLGEALRCLNSGAPAGCGANRGCAKCQIRTTIAQALRHRQACASRTTYLLKSGEGYAETHIDVTAQQSDGAVLLRLDIQDIA